MADKADSIVIGGGILGMLTARELALNGLKVILIDKGEPGNECSWAGGGILSPLYPWRIPDTLQPLVSLSQGLYPELISSLITTTGKDPEWVKSGLLILDTDDGDQAIAWADSHQMEVNLIKPEDFANYGQGISGHFNSAIWFPGVAQVRNPLLINAVRQSLGQLKVLVKTHEEVCRVNILQGKYCSVETSRGTYFSDSAVVACGAWSSHLLSELPVYPVRGQMLCLYDHDHAIKFIVLSQETYIIPRKDGHVLIGSTMEEVGFNNTITRQARYRLFNKACEIYPDIGHFEFIKHWSGLRPGIQGEIPLIGRYPEVEGLYLNTGHFRNGLLLSTGSARVLMEIMLGKSTSIPVAPFQFEYQNRALTC